MISQTKSLKIKSFLPPNFAVIKICLAIRLAEDETRMGGIQFRVSPSLTSIKTLCKVTVFSRVKSSSESTLIFTKFKEKSYVIPHFDL